jgi:hypothetical protein
MDPGAMIYMPGSKNTGSGIEKYMGGIDRYITWWFHKPNYIFQNKESRLNISPV